MAVLLHKEPHGVVIHKQRLHNVHLVSFCFACITMEIFPTSSVASNFPVKPACFKSSVLHT